MSEANAKPAPPLPSSIAKASRSAEKGAPVSIRMALMRARRSKARSATFFRTRLQRCDGDWWPLLPRRSHVAHAAPLGTDTKICDTVRLKARREWADDYAHPSLHQGRLRRDRSGHRASSVQDAPRGQGLVRGALPGLAHQRDRSDLQPPNGATSSDVRRRRIGAVKSAAHPFRRSTG